MGRESWHVEQMLMQMAITLTGQFIEIGSEGSLSSLIEIFGDVAVWEVSDDQPQNDQNLL